MAESIRKEDWERFRALGKVPPRIREVVLQSWQRSEADRGIPSLKQAPRVADDEFAAIRQQTGRLREAARPALERAGYMLNHANAMVLLCNDRGVVTDTTGDARTIARGQENHLHIGGQWDEGAIGTNAIGTAIHTRRPVQIWGVEHYCEEIQRWNCAATPVCDPVTGELLGLVDISGPSEFEQPHSAALSMSMALQIEESLRQQVGAERQQLTERLLVRRMRWVNDEVMVLDRYGAEAFATEHFAQMAGDLCDLTEFRRMASGLSQRPREEVMEELHAAMPNASMELVEDTGRPIGVVVALRRRQRNAPSRPALTLDRIAAGGVEISSVCEQARRLAASRMPILVEGETGSGKEVLARGIHRESGDPERPFEVLNCSLLTADRLRQELSEGALIARLSRAGGTVCLDEPADTPADAQALLLEVAKAFGGAETSSGPVRIVSLSARDLSADVQEGRFRGDLYYRLAAARIAVPPLRQRSDEVAHLLKHFARELAERSRRPELRFTPAATDRLSAYRWPGNVRELRNLVETLFALSRNRLVDLRDLPPEIVTPARADCTATLRAREKAEIVNAIASVDGNLTEAARRLGIARSTLYLKLDEHGIQRARRH